MARSSDSLNSNDLLVLIQSLSKGERKIVSQYLGLETKGYKEMSDLFKMLIRNLSRFPDTFLSANKVLMSSKEKRLYTLILRAIEISRHEYADLWGYKILKEKYLLGSSEEHMKKLKKVLKGENDHAHLLELYEDMRNLYLRYYENDKSLDSKIEVLQRKEKESLRELRFQLEQKLIVDKQFIEQERVFRQEEVIRQARDLPKQQENSFIQLIEAYKPGGKVEETWKSLLELQSGKLSESVYYKSLLFKCFLQLTESEELKLDQGDKAHEFLWQEIRQMSKKKNLAPLFQYFQPFYLSTIGNEIIYSDVLDLEVRQELPFLATWYKSKLKAQEIERRKKKG